MKYDALKQNEFVFQSGIFHSCINTNSLVCIDRLDTNIHIATKLQASEEQDYEKVNVKKK
jgi:hypothetical protein